MSVILFRITTLAALISSFYSQPTVVPIQKEVTVKDFNGPMTKEILSALAHVEKLQIENSIINDYPSHVFSLLPNIKNIVVKKSNFKIMDKNIYKGANKLEEIYFAHNDVPELPLSLLRYTTFKKIVISDQPQVKEIPPNFANETTRLKYFECSECSIKTIHNDAFTNLSKLEVLDLRKNSIKELSSKTLEPLKNLTTLCLQNNLFKKFTTANLPYLEKLTKIDLSHNPLKEFDLLDFIKVTPSLESVDIRNTNVSEADIDEHVRKTNIFFITDRDRNN